MDDAQRILVEARMLAVEQQLDAYSERFKRIEASQDLNTRVTLDTRSEVTGIRDDFKKLGDKLEAPMQYYDRAMMGLRVLGVLGATTMWLVRRWYLFVGVAIGVKILASGGSVHDAWNSFLKALRLGD